MSLQTRLTALAAAIGADVKALFTRSIPPGGHDNYVLGKLSSTDYDVGWVQQGYPVTVLTQEQYDGLFQKESGRLYIIREE